MYPVLLVTRILRDEWSRDDAIRIRGRVRIVEDVLLGVQLQIQE